MKKIPNLSKFSHVLEILPIRFHVFMRLYGLQWCIIVLRIICGVICLYWMCSHGDIVQNVTFSHVLTCFSMFWQVFTYPKTTNFINPWNYATHDPPIKYLRRDLPESGVISFWGQILVEMRASKSWKMVKTWKNESFENAMDPIWMFCVLRRCNSDERA